VYIGRQCVEFRICESQIHAHTDRALDYETCVFVCEFTGIVEVLDDLVEIVGLNNDLGIGAGNLVDSLRHIGSGYERARGLLDEFLYVRKVVSYCRLLTY
jgi:hypothetical protein